ncbi:NACHT N-terminal Helical domain 1-containing protein [Streptomyces sp. CMB-StM0423]|uniref:NACHT N-terminal Helical domain 1-containing protein n=1 Tax=Streptomyces sp. CMB-StM0423 TaxID=2059884 RepID=UPI001F29365F|nr:hypothetical protein [Streptomyces sp. CMB-StM0423]
MIAETAALRLGTMVANAAGKLWLGGRQREQERQLPMEELVRVRVPGVRLQREVTQQFEQITNAVYDRLDPYLTHAFDRLDPGGRQAVIDAVADTFARADLSDDALLAADAQPAELVRRITASVRPPTGLGETETRLYETLFAECIAYYVRIVRSLPVFEERAAAELLARTSTLGAEVARILERLPDRSLFAPDGSDLDTGFRRTYLELVSRELDEVELFRGTSDQAAPQRVRPCSARCTSTEDVICRATGWSCTATRCTPLSTTGMPIGRYRVRRTASSASGTSSSSCGTWRGGCRTTTEARSTRTGPPDRSPRS